MDVQLDRRQVVVRHAPAVAPESVLVEVLARAGYPAVLVGWALPVTGRAASGQR